MVAEDGVAVSAQEQINYNVVSFPLDYHQILPIFLNKDVEIRTKLNKENIESCGFLL